MVFRGHDVFHFWAACGQGLGESGCQWSFSFVCFSDCVLLLSFLHWLALVASGVVVRGCSGFLFVVWRGWDGCLLPGEEIPCLTYNRLNILRSWP